MAKNPEQPLFTISVDMVTNDLVARMPGDGGAELARVALDDAPENYARLASLAADKLMSWFN